MTRTQKTQPFEAHRCEGSLRARCSIRRLRSDLLVNHLPGAVNFFMSDRMWHLFVREYDFEWDSTYMRHVARVRFCPFCGAELPDS